MEFHEYANIFPLMGEEEMARLVEDVREKGLLEQIVVFEGKVLDGRNRWVACERLGIEDEAEREAVEYDEIFVGATRDDAFKFVISKNLVRRHLTAGQIGIIAAKAEGMREEERKKAKARMAKGGKGDFGEGKQKSAEVGAVGQVRDKVSEMFGISHDTYDKSRDLLKEKPELAVQVENGEITLNRAFKEYRKETNREHIKEAQELPDTKYRIIYADPPWSYGDTRDGLKGYTSADYHYPAMSIQQLCDMEISEITLPDAVLFLWVTSPLLEDCFKVIKAWGFQYKTSFVWDKVKHNFGHYNSVRHELLLICTKGSCVPDSKELHDSVVSLERSENHSEKPEYFRELIDKMYPHGKRIELFARKKVKGWDSWGNE